MNSVRNPVREALLERRVTIGTWIQIGHPAVAEILARGGFEWVAADCEHADIDVHCVAELCRAVQGRDTVPMVRVRENDTLAIRQVLDMGARGVIVPLVNSAEEAEQAVRAAKYPPRGIRGYGFARMNNWGADFDAYADSANDDVAVVVMIESASGVENIDAILSVDGVDGVFVGPYDLSGSYGMPGKTGAETVVEACRHVVAACERAGKAAGLHVVMPEREAIRRALKDGYTFIALGVDSVFLERAAYEALSATRP